MSLRHLTLAFAALAIFLPSTASAQVPSNGFTLSNGYIAVTDRVQLVDGAVGNGKQMLTLRSWHSPPMNVDITTGGTVNLNSPYGHILAGTQYTIQYGARNYATVTVTPRVCSARGVLFGYAAVFFSGTISFDEATHSFVPHIVTHLNMNCPA